mmetsp:Transcript_4359/g.9515  ORF Transcript_4359/g.9515 Transcript_4359/m.9515 type:complete len:277 (-) Transcript_4359:858-1688(-)
MLSILSLSLSFSLPVSPSCSLFPYLLLPASAAAPASYSFLISLPLARAVAHFPVFSLARCYSHSLIFKPMSSLLFFPTPFSPLCFCLLSSAPPPPPLPQPKFERFKGVQTSSHGCTPRTALSSSCPISQCIMSCNSLSEKSWSASVSSVSASPPVDSSISCASGADSMGTSSMHVHTRFEFSSTYMRPRMRHGTYSPVESVRKRIGSLATLSALSTPAATSATFAADSGASAGKSSLVVEPLSLMRAHSAAESCMNFIRSSSWISTAMKISAAHTG